MAQFMANGVNPNLGFALQYMRPQDQSIANAAMSGQPISTMGGVVGAYGGGAANYSYLGNGQYGMYNPGGAATSAMPNTPQDLFNQQRQANLDTRNYNRGLWNEVKNYTTSVPQAYANDSLTQGARGLAGALVANPEALNDRTQQLAVNRASNLLNAAGNAQRRGTMQGLASRGMLGGSAQQAALGGIERQRQAQLVGLGSDLEVRRAMQRNQDIMNATNLASGLAGQQAAISGDAARTLMSGVPYEAPDDMSGLGAMLGIGAGLGGALSGGYTPGSNVGIRRNSPANPYATQLNGMNQEGPSWSPYGLPYGTQPAAYSYGGNTDPNQIYGNWATGGRLDTGNGTDPWRNYVGNSSFQGGSLPSQYYGGGTNSAPGIYGNGQYYAPGTYANKSPGAYF